MIDELKEPGTRRNYLRSYPVDYLKIVAEGVENESQLAVLQAYGCHYTRGYLFGKKLVEPRRIELPTFALRTRRSPS